jgi:hypothetical protein
MLQLSLEGAWFQAWRQGQLGGQVQAAKQLQQQLVCGQQLANQGAVHWAPRPAQKNQR